MSNNSSPAEQGLGMLFEAICFACLLIHRLYKEWTQEEAEEAQE